MELDMKPNLELKSLSSTIPDSSSVQININLYRTIPFGQLTLEECEDLFRQRLEALNIIEKTIEKQSGNLLSNSLREIKSYVFKTNCILLQRGNLQQQKQDHFSHMLLRMYCIYNHNLWDWFKNCEKRLLHYRLKDQAISSGQLEAILQDLKFKFERVTGPEYAQLKRDGMIGWNRLTEAENLDVFKVRFVDALKFIGKRSVSLKQGYAYLSKTEMISVVCDVFERFLDDELNYARQHLNVELSQTQQLLGSLDLVYKDYIEKVEEELREAKKNLDGARKNPYLIDINNLEEVKKSHYPPCMRYMHDALIEDHHLKHQARLYYGAFLRTGGVELEAAIEFWRKEFTKKIPNDKFERDYKYNIRHLYGKEGHKKALTSFSCDKIINSNAPGPTEKHGCPFKHFDDVNLKKMLSGHGLKDVDIESVLLERRNSEPKKACSRYFAVKKGHEPTMTIENPIHFYQESMRLLHRPIKEDQEDFEEMEALET